MGKEVTAEKKSYNKQYYEKFKKRQLYLSRVRQEENRSAWMAVISSKGMDKCCKCGYDKFFGIDFHHVRPEEKKYKPAEMIRGKITADRLLELDKCVALCRNCHAEEHEKMRKRVK